MTTSWFRSLTTLGKTVRSGVRSGHLHLAGVALLVLVTACGGNAPAPELNLDTSMAEVVRGGTVQIEVSLSPLGAADSATLEVEGLPTGVSAAFSPATLSGTTSTSLLTLDAAASATEGSYDVQVRANGGSLEASADLDLTVTSLTISGRIVSILNVPVGNVDVESQGFTTEADAAGVFTLAGLSLPYDVTVWSTPDEWIHRFEAILTDEPVLPVLQIPATSLPIRGTTISGDLSGGQIPVGANQEVTVCVRGAAIPLLSCDRVPPGNSSYSVSVLWLGETSIEATLHALQYQIDPVTGYPVSYQGYSSLDLTLADATPVMAPRNLGDALETVEVQVDIESPTGVIATYGGVQVAPDLTLGVMRANGTDVSHTVLMPVIAGATYTFGSGPDIQQFAWQVGVTGTLAAVNMPTGATLMTPADTATGVTESTNFSITGGITGQTVFHWWDGGGNFSAAVTTMSTSAQIPDPSDYGLTLPVSAPFEWRVHRTNGDEVGTGSDDLRNYFAFSSLTTGPSRGFTGSGWHTMTDSRGFTTGP